jgi:Zn-dependent peptidase ImmA (M78 family)
MGRLTRKQVEQRAQNVLDEHGMLKPPIRVDRLAEKLSYNVIYQRLAGDVSGTVILDQDETITIGINSFHSHVRQRFSIAHEIGHAQLHVSSAKDTRFVDPPARVLFRDGTASLGEDPQEIQANQFAAALLMPQHLVSEIGQTMIDRNPKIAIDDLVNKLAERFDVSTQAMRYRLVTFGVLEPN